MNITYCILLNNVGRSRFFSDTGGGKTTRKGTAGFRERRLQENKDKNLPENDTWLWARVSA